MLFRDGDAVFLEGGDVSADRFLDVFYRVLSGLPLAHATGKAGTLGDPIAIFPLVKHHLAHRRTSMGITWHCTSWAGKRAGYRPWRVPIRARPARIRRWPVV